MTEHVHSYHMGQCTPCLLERIEQLSAELAIWRQCHSVPKFDSPDWCPRCTQPYERCCCNGTTTGSAQPPGDSHGS